MKCEKEGKFVEAEISKQRVSQLIKVKDDKMLEETKIKHEEMKNLLQNEQQNELKNFNENFDKKFYEMNAEFQEMENKLKNQHKQDLEQFLFVFNQSFPQIPKPSTELINLNRTLEICVKKKE